MGELLCVTELRKSFRIGRRPVEVLRGVSLTVDRGEVVAITGPSGSGKSTLFNLLGGLDEPSGGSIVFDGRDMGSFSAADRVRHRQRSIGFVFQSFNLLSSMTAVQNVELPLTLSGVPRRERRDRALAMLGELGLGGRAAHRPGELSGGEQQRVAIARAIVTGSQMMLADEPTGNLDTENGRHILEMIRGLNAAQGLTVILTTHDLAVAQWADRIVELRDGLVVKGTLNANAPTGL